MEVHNSNSTVNSLQEDAADELRSGSAETVSSTESGGSQSSEKTEIKAEGTLFQRALSWVSGGLYKPSSSYDKSSFESALENRYGKNIAAKVMSFESQGLSKKSVAWNSGKLSLATVAKARDLAEFLETSGLGDKELATSETALLRADVKQWKAAIKTAAKLIPADASDRATKLTQLQKGLEAAEAKLAGANKNNICDVKTAGTRIEAGRVAVKTALQDVFESIRKTGVALPSKEKIKAEFKKQQIIVRNEQPWDPINASVTTMKVDGTKVTNKTTITPASNFMKIEERREGEEEQISLGGICSGNNDNENHAVNLCVDRLHAPEGSPDGSPDALIAVRGGVDVLPSKVEEVADDGTISKRPVTDQEHQATFNKRFDEGLVACLEAKGQLHDVVQGGKGNSKENPIDDLDIADLGFLSQFDKEETAMQTRQFKMLDEVNNKPREITYKDPSGAEKKIWVKSKIIAFNFGVEWGDRGIIGERNLPPGWREKNDESLNALEEKAAAFIAANPRHQDAHVIQQLKEQIKTIRLKGEVYSNSDDYYAVAARVILLSYKLGMVPKIHCKSGKDRTSRAIEAAKALAIEIQNSPKVNANYGGVDMQVDTVPAPIPATPEQSTLRKKVGFNSGNQGIQELNTDFRGNKQYSAFGFMEGLSYLASKVAGYTTAAVTEYKGLSNLAKR
ncbi:MAG: hypothetical protein K2W97_00685 [Chthoniobacterales bacterium]|nr:hypothetical protein [Chthoniobacterales bacterium]